MSKSKLVKPIAMYFPQLHRIPENDQWWGEGFTDWVNVKAAQPQFDGHYQPRVPLGFNYYDQSKIETMRWQIDLAKSYGMYGFCHYHYWFDGKQLLETPTNLMLDNKDLDMPFCLSWANETWSKRWDGQNNNILIKQTHPPSKERWKLHFNYLIKAWRDKRAIKVNNKPVFIIYRPHNIQEVHNMIDYWRELALDNGLDGLYLVYQKQYELPDRECLEAFDAVFQFQPFEAIYDLASSSNSLSSTILVRFFRMLPETAKKAFRSLRSQFANGLTLYDYDSVWEHIVAVRTDPDLVTFPGAFVDWDNTARYKKKATVFQNVSIERFEYWLTRLVKSMPKRDIPEPFIFINAWNEWAESTYLEPDEKNGYDFLAALQRALAETETSIFKGSGQGSYGSSV